MDEKTRDDLLKLFQSKLNEAMRFYLETCSRCGTCTEACHAYQSMGQTRYISAYRHELVRRINKKYFKGQGKVLRIAPTIDATSGTVKVTVSLPVGEKGTGASVVAVVDPGNAVDELNEANNEAVYGPLR
jgi:Fe-S oxidoreductase